MPNAVENFSTAIDGLWLVPHRNNFPVSGAEAWIGGTSPPLNAEVSMDEYTIFNRAEELSQDGVLHLDRGAISDGLIMARHNQTAATWLNRLQALVRDQRSYGYILLVSPSWSPFKVKLSGLSKSVTIAGGRAYLITLPFREVT